MTGRLSRMNSPYMSLLLMILLNFRFLHLAHAAW